MRPFATASVLDINQDEPFGSPLRPTFQSRVLRCRLPDTDGVGVNDAHRQRGKLRQVKWSSPTDSPTPSVHKRLGPTLPLYPREEFLQVWARTEASGPPGFSGSPCSSQWRDACRLWCMV